MQLPLIMLTQPVLMPIDDAAALDALADADRARVRYPAAIDTTDLALRATRNGDWAALRDAIGAEHARVLEPLLKNHREASLAYYGTAPVPAAMYLGFLVGTWPAVKVFQRHHQGKDWRWRDVPPSRRVIISALPTTRTAVPGEVIIRVSTTSEVDRDETLAVVPNPLLEIDIRTDELGPDVLAHADEVEAVADQFQRALDTIGMMLPGTTTIHVFAAVPGGVAFRLGNKVSTTQHAEIQTYQYEKTATPRHRRAIRLQREIAEPAALTSDERMRGVELRGRIAKSLGDLQDYFRRSPSSSFPGVRDLSPSETIIMSDLSVKASAGDGFGYDRVQRLWRLDDGLVNAISKHFAEEQTALRAFRMLLLHEALHDLEHGLTESLSTEAWRLAGIVESIDFEADVWAATHEFAYTRERIAPPSMRDIDIWHEILRTITSTFRAFDMARIPFDTIEPRRLNRYLTWCWQRLRVERCATTDDVRAVLVDKPQIEFGGLRPLVVRGRHHYELQATSELELSVRHRARLHRFGVTGAHRLRDLVDALRRVDGEQICAVLRGPFDQACQGPSMAV